MVAEEIIVLGLLGAAAVGGYVLSTQSSASSPQTATVGTSSGESFSQPQASIGTTSVTTNPIPTPPPTPSSTYNPSSTENSLASQNNSVLSGNSQSFADAINSIASGLTYNANVATNVAASNQLLNAAIAASPTGSLTPEEFQKLSYSNGSSASAPIFNANGGIVGAITLTSLNHPPLVGQVITNQNSPFGGEAYMTTQISAPPNTVVGYESGQPVYSLNSTFQGPGLYIAPNGATIGAQTASQFSQQQNYGYLPGGANVTGPPGAETIIQKVNLSAAPGSSNISVPTSKFSSGGVAIVPTASQMTSSELPQSALVTNIQNLVNTVTNATKQYNQTYSSPVTTTTTTTTSPTTTTSSSTTTVPASSTSTIPQFGTPVYNPENITHANYNITAPTHYQIGYKAPASNPTPAPIVQTTPSQAAQTPKLPPAFSFGIGLANQIFHSHISI